MPEHVIRLQTAFRNKVSQGCSIYAVCACRFRCNESGRGIKSHETAGVRFNISETGAELGVFGKRRGAGRVKNHEPTFYRLGCEAVQKITDFYALRGNIGVVNDGCIDRREVIFALKLKAVATEIDEGHGLRPGSTKFGREVTQRSA